MSNFTFLETYWSDLSRLGDLSEKYVYSDPNTSVIKQGMLAELMVKYMLAYDGIKEPEYDNTHANRIRLLKKNDLLPYEIDNTLYILRKDRNDAAHNGVDEGERALNNLPLLYELCVWYMQSYGDYGYNPIGYVEPVDITISLDELERENRELEERNQTLRLELQRIQEAGGANSARRAMAYKKAANVKLSEALTGVCTPNKYTIAYMLDGSLLQTDTITYGNSVTPCQVPEKEGYTFSGWSELPATMPATDLVINGAYTINKYRLTYLVDGAVYKEHEVTYNDTIIAEAAPVKDGYRFGGWSEIPVRMPAHDVQVDGVFIEIVYCGRPVISYADGQLTFTSQTEGVEFVSSITCDDVNTYRDAQVALSVAYNVSVYATKEGCENSDTVTAVLCWIECDHQDEEEKGILKVASTPALIQSSNGIIIIQGLEKGTSVSVYTTSGMEVASGVAEENVTLTLDTQMTKGEVAIVKMGAKSVKVMMK